MKVVGTANRWIQCRRPQGCGWYWQMRTVKDHWWSRPRNEYRGAFWEHEDHDPRLSSRPDDPANKQRWFSQEAWDDWYADCGRHVQEVQQLTAFYGSAQTGLK